MRDKPVIAYIAALVLVTACHSRKQAETASAPATETGMVQYDTLVTPQNGSVNFVLNYTGIVRDMSQHEGCGFMIELDAGNGEKLLLEPLMLDEKYRVDGKKIEFSYTDSRRPSQCTLPSKPIVIDTIIE
ncbi:MAG: hypothetical protein HYZ14_02625 [Bacteroidetes bacterium]|nr:hypothetical protein [Bacteroidota bacterium]